MDPRHEFALLETRRYFFGRTAAGIGTAALASLLNPQLLRRRRRRRRRPSETFGELPALHHAPKAKRIIWLFMADAPSQLDLFDYKPKLQEFFDKDLPDSVRKGQRITTMTSGQARLPVAPSLFKFAAIRQAGRVAQRVAAAHRHDRRRHRDRQDGQHRGDQPRPGHHVHSDRQPDSRPAEHRGLAVVRHRQPESGPAGLRRAALAAGARRSASQALFSRLWGSGFLPTKHQGVALRSSGDPVLVSVESAGRRPTAARRQMLDGLAELQPAEAGRGRRSRKSPPASRSTKWRSACRPRCPS